VRLSRVLSAQGAQATPLAQSQGHGESAIMGMAGHVWQFDDGHVSTKTPPLFVRRLTRTRGMRHLDKTRWAMFEECAQGTHGREG
jgi:hypothetical protein